MSAHTRLSFEPETTDPTGVVAELLKLVSSIEQAPRLWRGQSQAWTPAPTSYRDGLAGISHFGAYRQFREFVHRYAELGGAHDVFWLAFAQHRGVPTPLLDWTTNPLVAAYFAATGAVDESGEVIYSADTFESFDLDRDIRHMFDVGEVVLIDARRYFARAAAQSGVMTFHPRSLRTNPIPWFLPGQSFDTIEIKPTLKPVLLEGLARVGISRTTLFPDIEGALDEFRRLVPPVAW